MKGLCSSETVPNILSNMNLLVISLLLTNEQISISLFRASESYPDAIVAG